MIVWVASFPRSGNTFLRIVLHRLYGVRTSVVYDFDGVADRLGPDLIGFEERSSPIEILRAAPEPYFVKTHRQRDDLVDHQDRAICLVRDGRDALVSWARLQSRNKGDDALFEPELRRMILEDEAGTGSWGANVLSWLQPPSASRVVLRYEDLTRDPRGSLKQAISRLIPDLRPIASMEPAEPAKAGDPVVGDHGGSHPTDSGSVAEDQAVGDQVIGGQAVDQVIGDQAIPSFDELRRIDGGFFRRGVTGTYVDEMPEELHQLFWSRPENVTAMALLA
jgi:Sulfotransferase domain